ncbi:hypothetical protein ACO02O_06841 [Dirofilaria immitis]
MFNNVNLPSLQQSRPRYVFIHRGFSCKYMTKEERISIALRLSMFLRIYIHLLVIVVSGVTFIIQSATQNNLRSED